MRPSTGCSRRCERGHAVLLADLSEPVQVSVAPLLAIHSHDQACELHLRRRAQHGQRLADGGPRGGHVLDEQHAVAVAQVVPDQDSAFTVVFGFFAVEAIADVASVFAMQRDCGRCRKRDALVSWPEQHVEAAAELVRDGLRVEACEPIQLGARAETARVDEVRGLTTALGREVTEAQYVALHQELDELALMIFHAAKHAVISLPQHAETPGKWVSAHR
jgi:hypothetical protein